MTNQQATDGHDYDPRNFAAVMRECLILVMNRIDKVEKDEHDFWQSQKQIVPLRRAIEKFYRWQVDKYSMDALPLWVFGMVALKALEDGATVARVKGMFGFAVKKRYTATLEQARALYAEMGAE